MIRSLFPASLLALCLFATGCAPHPGVHALKHPVVDTPFAVGLLNPKKFSPDTQAALATAGLTATAKKDPVAAIKTLWKKLDENPDDLMIRVALSELCEDQAEKLAPKEAETALGFYLAAAETAYPALRGQANPSRQHAELLALYNESCAEAATLIFRLRSRTIRDLSVEGPNHPYSISVRKPGHGICDLAFFDEIHSASVLEIKGFETDHRQDGIGGALVAYREGTDDRRAANPFLSPFGMAEPLSAILSFQDPGKVRIAYHDVLVEDQVQLFGESRPLDADFTAALATLLSHEPKKNIGWEGMIHPEECLKYQGLYLLHEYRSDLIPVVLVHGLMSSPDTWRELVSAISSEPDIRRRYQFLVYQYPTGFPIPHNAAGLRSYLKQFTDRYDPAGSNPKMNEMVLIGHSMGGLLTSMQIRDGGDPVWYAIHEKPIKESGVSEHLHEPLRELVYFKANPNVTRAIFVCAPHRGSEIANNALGEFGAMLIKSPFQMVEGTGDIVSGEPDTLEGSFLQHPSDGIRGLRAHAEVLEEVVKLPVRPGVTVHSIVGDRGKNDPREKSSDGVVAYWSAHLDGVASERVVPTSHVGAPHDDGTIEEISRILRLHAGEMSGR